MDRESTLRLPLWIAAWATLGLAWWVFRLEPAVRPQVDNDTQCYAEAARAIREGRSPYQEGERCYLYPPAMAHALARLPEPAPLSRARIAFWLNSLASLGFAMTLPIAAGLGRHPLGLLSALWLWSPVTTGAVGTGNVAIWVAWLPLLALVSLPRAPLLAGLLLGLATAMKTMPGLYLVFLGIAGIRTRNRGYLWACGTGLAVTAVGLLSPWTWEFLHLSGDQVALHAREVRNFSFVSLVWWTFGDEPPSPWPLVAAGLLGALILGGRVPARSSRSIVADWALLGVLAHATAPIAWTMSFPQTFLAASLLVWRVLDWPAGHATSRQWLAAGTRLALAAAVAVGVALPAAFWTPRFPWMATIPTMLALGAGIGVRASRWGKFP